MNAEAARRRHRKTLGRRLHISVSNWSDCKDHCVLARVVAARCELESGDTLTGDMILADLECDLVGIAERHDEPRGLA